MEITDFFNNPIYKEFKRRQNAYEEAKQSWDKDPDNSALEKGFQEKLKAWQDYFRDHFKELCAQPIDDEK